MTLLDQANRFYLYASRKYFEPGSPEYQLLSKIDNAPFHYLPTDQMTPEEVSLAKSLEKRYYVAHIPADHGSIQEYIDTPKGELLFPRKNVKNNRSLPDRYVLLSNGTHALGLFEFSDLDRSLEEYYRSLDE